MTFRAVWLWVGLAGLAGCYEEPWYPYRAPCPKGETCCPPGTHELQEAWLDAIICALDEPPCADAGADGGACQEAGVNAP